MALLYQAELRPSKLELITAWAPTQPWFEGSADASFGSVASFRFDDPDGEVGIETILVSVGNGPVLQVPLTYRGAPLEGGDSWLIATMQHSVLGQRWVYDATGDPVYLAAVATAAFTGGRHAEQYLDSDGELVLREPTAVVAGSGQGGMPAVSLPSAGTVSARHEHGATIVEAGDLRLIVARVLSPGSDVYRSRELCSPNDDAALESLTATWTDQPEPHTLVLAWILSD